MKKLLLILICCMGVMLCHGQFTRPDYNAIKKAISNPRSEFYYPRLLERYYAGDTTFTTKESHYLYYGYVFQKEYDPYDMSDLELRKHLRELPSVSDDDCRELIAMAQEVLKKNPFKVSAFRTILYCCDQLDSTELATKCSWMQRTFAIAIIESGNGKEPSSAFYVNEVEHEYFLLSLFDLTPGGEQNLQVIGNERYDVLKIDKNDYNIEKLYFNLKSFSIK